MDPIEKIICIAKENQELTPVISDTVKILRMTLSKVRDKKSFEDLINVLKTMAKRIREECPVAFPVLNIINQILSKLCSEVSDEEQQQPRMLELLSMVDKPPVNEKMSESSP